MSASLRRDGALRACIDVFREALAAYELVPGCYDMTTMNELELRMLTAMRHAQREAWPTPRDLERRAEERRIAWKN